MHWIFRDGEHQGAFIKAAKQAALDAEQIARVKALEGLRELREAACSTPFGAGPKPTHA